MMELLSDPQAWIALLTLTALELVLGIDNIIFISILVDKLPKEQQQKARLIGPVRRDVHAHRAAAGAVVGSWGSWRRSSPWPARPSRVRDLILILGGLFLIWKSTGEIHEAFTDASAAHDESKPKVATSTFGAVIFQVMLVDMVFSLDSIITAVGMVDEIAVMIAAVISSVALMMLFAGAIGRFVSDHPTIKMLALSFLVVGGVVLIAEGFDQHVPKGYIYFAMAFSVGVEMLNIRMRRPRPARPSDLPGA